MFAIICRRRLIRVSNSPQFLAPANAVLVKSFSFKKPSSGVNGDDPRQSFTISYLINKCGLSSKDALTASKIGRIRSPANAHSVLKLLRKYEFTNANIQKLVTRWPKVLSSCPKETLLPKLKFFHSIGVPNDVLAERLSLYPLILQRSLENYLIPSYNCFKTLCKTDKGVVNVFKRAPRAFAHGWQREITSNIAVLRERGVAESSIASLMTHHPWFLVIGTKKFASYIDRAAEMGFDRTKVMFIHALQVFAQMSESTLKHKMEVYRRCGWSQSDISSAFLKHPLCMTISEKKIMDNMNFLVNDLGLQPISVAQLPVLLGLNLDKRMKPRCLVARVLKERGLLKKRIKASTFLKMPEEKFLNRYIVNYQEDVPELLDIYRGKFSVSEMGFSQEAIFK